jgi:hypothetical protein
MTSISWHTLPTCQRNWFARLRDLEQFQRARYEILIASLFVRCAFAIEFVNNSSKRNPEFFAQKDGERLAVEAKSGHRAGVLNRRGQFDKDDTAEIKRLYEDAAGQKYEIRSFSDTRSFILPIIMKESVLARIAKDPPSKVQG